jgi:antitoxin MazE
MPSQHLKVARIGNSRGVRIPAGTLARYRIGDEVIMEEREDGILLKPIRSASPKLSWADTAEAMRDVSEDWSDWDDVVSDGLDPVPLQRASSQARAKRVAEPSPSYTVKRSTKRPTTRPTKRRDA